LSLSVPGPLAQALVTAIADSRITHLTLYGYVEMDQSRLRCLKQITHLSLYYADDGDQDYLAEDAEEDDETKSAAFDQWQDTILFILSDCPQLLSLDMGKHAWMLNDEGLTEISTLCPHLTSVDVSFYDVAFDNRRLSALGYTDLIENCLSLAHLDLSGWGISDETRNTLKVQYPNLKIIT
jgi:hypothetical protein